MKHILFSLSVLLCTYSLHINADQLTDEITNLTQALNELGRVITNQPAPTPLIPVATGPTMEEQIKINLENLDDIIDYLQTAQLQIIPLSDEDLNTWRAAFELLKNHMGFFKYNDAGNIDAQTKIVAIKDSTVKNLVSLKDLALTQDQADTLLQYIDEFYTNGVAQPDYRMLLGDMSSSNATIGQLKNDLNVIIQAQINLDNIQTTLNNFKIVLQPRSIPLSDEDLKTWQAALESLKNNMQFFKDHEPDNIDAQTKIIAIKDSIINFLDSLKYLVLTKDQANTLLQYINEFYTNGVAQPDYQTLLGDMSTSNATIEELKNDLNAIINIEQQIQMRLDDLDAIQKVLNDFKTIQQPQQIPLSQTDLNTWKTELTALSNDIQFFKNNALDNADAQTKIIAIKNSIVEFLVYLKMLALTENQANTLLQYIDEFYTNGVAQPDYQTLLGDMSASNATIEQLKNDLNAIINPVTPLVPVPTPTEPLTPLVPAPEETQPLTPLVPMPEETQPLTPLIPAPTQPLIPTTPVVPDVYKQAIPKLISNIQLDQPRIQALFDNGDTDTMNTFMTKNAAQVSFYAQSFSDYNVKISSYYKYLTTEQKEIVLTFLNSIQTGLDSDGMKTLPNLPKAQSDVATLLQKINP